jgi:signal transduction histidine kinase
MADQQVKVLLVDDDEDDAVLIRDWLAEIETATFEVDWAQTYHAGVEAIEGSQHDVYLVDYRLGERTGLEILQQVMGRGSKAPVIMLTGAGSRRVDEEAMQAGAADYLVKTQLNADLLERAIRYALKHKQAEMALQKARDELELRVLERTAELTKTNDALRAEFAERKRAEQRLRDSERLVTIGTTAAKLAHEIGNPLNGMATTVQLIERHLAKQKDTVDEVLSSAVQDLAQEIHRLRSLLQKLRALARPRPLDLEPTDLAAIAAEVLRREAAYYAEHRIRVEQAFAANLSPVMANTEEFTQVLLNLYKNAVEAMPEGGTLTVRVFQSGTHACLEVSDTGTGILEEVNIFEPFVTTKTKGTGLGLAIVQQIVAAHGGTITYTSTADQGTTFTLALPVAAAEAAARPPFTGAL